MKYRRVGVLFLTLLPLVVKPLKADPQTCESESQLPSSTPTEEFRDHGDGTVTHLQTGLMWMKCSLGQQGEDCSLGNAEKYNWKDALEGAMNTTFAGFSNWRVPNIKELRSIVEERCMSPSINSTIFPSTPAYYYVSSSPSAEFGAVWGVDFLGGESGYIYPRPMLLHVRLVRTVE